MTDWLAEGERHLKNSEEFPNNVLGPVAWQYWLEWHGPRLLAIARAAEQIDYYFSPVGLREGCTPPFPPMLMSLADALRRALRGETT